MEENLRWAGLWSSIATALPSSAVVFTFNVAMEMIILNDDVKHRMELSLKLGGINIRAHVRASHLNTDRQTHSHEKKKQKMKSFPVYKFTSEESVMEDTPNNCENTVSDAAFMENSENTVTDVAFLENRENMFSLDRIVANVPMDKAQPQVESLCRQLSTLDLVDRQSTLNLAKELIDLTVLIANLILEALKNMAFKKTVTLEVSEKSVKKAVHKGLRQTFKAKLGATQQSIRDFLNLLSSQVTCHVNKCLSLPKDTQCIVPKEQLKAMMRRAKAMFLSMQEKVFLCCTGQESEEYSSQTYSQEQPQDQEVRADVHVAPPAQFSTEGPTFSSRASTAAEKDRPKRSSKIREHVLRVCPLSCLSSKGNDTSSLSSDEEPYRFSYLRETTDQVRDILLEEAVELSREDRDSLRDDSRDTATSIIWHIRKLYREHGSEVSLTESSSSSKESDTASSKTDSTSHETEVNHRLKAFFAFCVSKACLRQTLSKLCCSGGSTSKGSMEKVLEEASPLLKELLSHRSDIYETLPQSIAQGEHAELSEELAEIISTNIQLKKARPQFKEEIRAQINNFMTTISQWLRSQSLVPIHKDPVQRALGKIQHVFSRMSPQNSQKSTLSSTNTLHSFQHEEPVLFRELHPPPVHTPPMQTAPEQTPPRPLNSSTRSQPQHNLWSEEDCGALVWHLVSRIFKTKWRRNNSEMVTLSKALLEQLMAQISDWDVLVKPDSRSFQDIADAVYRDMRKGYKSKYVIFSAVANSGYSGTILEKIRGHLEQPQKRTVFSFLRSAWRTFKGF